MDRLGQVEPTWDPSILSPIHTHYPFLPNEFTKPNFIALIQFFQYLDLIWTWLFLNCWFFWGPYIHRQVGPTWYPSILSLHFTLTTPSFPMNSLVLTLLPSFNFFQLLDLNMVTRWLNVPSLPLFSWLYLMFTWFQICMCTHAIKFSLEISHNPLLPLLIFSLISFLDSVIWFVIAFVVFRFTCCI